MGINEGGGMFLRKKESSIAVLDGASRVLDE